MFANSLAKREFSLLLGLVTLFLLVFYLLVSIVFVYEILYLQIFLVLLLAHFLEHRESLGAIHRTQLVFKFSGLLVLLLL